MNRFARRNQFLRGSALVFFIGLLLSGVVLGPQGGGFVRAEAVQEPVVLTPEESRLIELINEERTAMGRRPLQVHMGLVRLARMKSRDMVDNDYFSHISPAYGSPYEMLDEAGIRYRRAAENIASTIEMPRVHELFMESRLHRLNILDPGLTHVGVGMVTDGVLDSVTTQLFIRAQQE